MATTTRHTMDGPRSTFQVGGAVSKTFSAWISNLIPFTVLSALVYSPFLIWMWLKFKGDFTAKDIQTWVYVSIFANLVLSQVVTGGITFGVVQHMRGKRAGIGACITVGLSRLFPVLVVGILVGVIVSLGFAFLIIPGVIFWLMYSVAVPVAVIEKPGITASLSRSASLTRGSRMPIFLTFLVLGVIAGVAYYALEVIMMPKEGGGLSAVRTYLWVTKLFQVLVTGTLFAVASAVIYNELRVSREGAAVEDIAKVFD